MGKFLYAELVFFIGEVGGMRARQLTAETIC